MPGGELVEKWTAALAKDLQEHRGRSVVIAGEYQPASVHALAHAMNSVAGQYRRDRHLRSIDRSKARRSPRVARRADDGDGCGSGAVARDPREQPGLHRARGSEVRRAARESSARGLSQPLSRRDRRRLSLEHSRHARARDLGRSPGVRRNRHADAAADCASLRCALRVRSAGSVHVAAHPQSARRHEGLLDARVLRRRRLVGQERGGRVVRERRRVLEGIGPRRLHPRHRRHWRWTGNAVHTRAEGAGSGCARRLENLADAGRSRARAGSCRCRGSCSASRAASVGRRTRTDLPARSERVGRTLRQQRLAAGSAEAADEAHVGHRRLGESEAG